MTRMSHSKQTTCNVLQTLSQAQLHCYKPTVKCITREYAIMPLVSCFTIHRTTSLIKITNLSHPVEAQLLSFSGAYLHVPLGFSEICLCNEFLEQIWENSWEGQLELRISSRNSIVQEIWTRNLEEQRFRIRYQHHPAEPTDFERLARTLNWNHLDIAPPSLAFLLQPTHNILTWISWTETHHPNPDHHTNRLRCSYGCDEPENHSATENSYDLNSMD
jgi:hypothetical protein